MAPVGLPAIAWMPPYVAQVPIATTPQARGASRSIHQFRVSGSPVRSSLPNEVQYPSPLMFSFGIDPSITRTNGASSPRAAARNGARYSSPPSVGESTLLCRWTVGSPGTRPITTSSIDGWDAAVTDTVSPSQLNPSEIQRMCTSSTPWGRPSVDPAVSTVIGSPSVVAPVPSCSVPYRGDPDLGRHHLCLHPLEDQPHRRVDGRRHRFREP